MQEATLAKALEETSGNVLLKLRMFDGLDNDAFEELLRVVDRCVNEFSSSNMIPKGIAAIFFDIYPAIVSASYLYDAKVSGEIQQAAEQLADRIRSCLNS